VAFRELCHELGGASTLLVFDWRSLACCAAVSSAGQSKEVGGANVRRQCPSSLGETLGRNSWAKDSIVYVHGIGSYGPNDRDSLAMRNESLAIPEGLSSAPAVLRLVWDYADRDDFPVGWRRSDARVF